jgi:hypothetical protein
LKLGSMRLGALQKASRLARAELGLMSAMGREWT